MGLNISVSRLVGCKFFLLLVSLKYADIHIVVYQQVITVEGEVFSGASSFSGSFSIG
ncbi:MAG: hypothetical protein ACI89Z_000078 [Porticoccus sp.]|jgi:hypothetical protein